MKVMRHSKIFLSLLFFGINTTSAEHKIVTRIFNFLEKIEDRSTFEQNKPLLKLIWHNRNILFKELTQTNPPYYRISHIFLKLAVFTSKNFDQIAPRGRDFYFSEDQLKRFWTFIVKKIKLLIKAESSISYDVRFIKITSSQDPSEEEDH